MTLIDGDRIVTAQLYDDEHEEFKEQKMSIIDFVNGYTSEGVTKADEVIDKIYTDIQKLRGCSCSCSDGIIDDVEDILDKYKGESEG